MDIWIITVLIIMILVFCLVTIKRRYRKTTILAGKIIIKRDQTGKKIFSLELDNDPEDIETVDQVIFDVVLEIHDD